MKIYIIEWIDGNSWYFSSKEKAEAYLKKVSELENEEYTEGEDYLFYSERLDLEILTIDN